MYSYTPRDPNMNSETYHYKRGANQQFVQDSHVFNPSLYPEDEVSGTGSFRIFSLFI